MGMSTKDDYFDNVYDFITHKAIGSPFSMDRLTPTSPHYSSLRKHALPCFLAPLRLRQRLGGPEAGIPASSRQTSYMPSVVLFLSC